MRYGSPPKVGPNEARGQHSIPYPQPAGTPTDREGVVEWVNPAFTSMTGYSLEEMAGRSSSILKGGVQGEAFYRELWETICSWPAPTRLS